MHQLGSITPQNGSTISGLERTVAAAGFPLLFCDALTFFIAADRRLATFTPSKSNIRIASSTLQVSAPSFAN
jgi:hypothetical protein